MHLKEVSRLHYLQIATLASVLFAIVGFSYNVWRAEETEKNNNIRRACFEIIRELGALEQIIYAARYDDDLVNGNPRLGWVKVGLINELSALTTKNIAKKAMHLKAQWSENWSGFHENQEQADVLIESIDALGVVIRKELLNLK